MQCLGHHSNFFIIRWAQSISISGRYPDFSVIHARRSIIWSLGAHRYSCTWDLQNRCKAVVTPVKRGRPFNMMFSTESVIHASASSHPYVVLQLKRTGLYNSLMLPTENESFCTMAMDVFTLMWGNGSDYWAPDISWSLVWCICNWPSIKNKLALFFNMWKALWP